MQKSIDILSILGETIAARMRWREVAKGWMMALHETDGKWEFRLDGWPRVSVKIVSMEY